MMSRFFAVTLGLYLLFGLTSPVSAQTSTAPQQAAARRQTAVSPSMAATTSATPTATLSAELSATPAATVQQKIQEKTDQDITETSGKTKDKLLEYLDKHPVGALSWHNPLQIVIRRAIANGLPANIIVLILLFPVITAIISFSRHVLGLKGFGIYIPAVLSVAFVSTGVGNGIFLFVVALAAALIMRRILKQLRLQSLPRAAMLLWGVSLVMLLTLIGASFVPLQAVLTVNIFPILIIMLLMENFLDLQLSTSQSEAAQLTLETLITAVVCSALIGAQAVQQYVILQPELTLFAVALVNTIVGRYAGLRLMEWIRFRSIID